MFGMVHVKMMRYLWLGGSWENLVENESLTFGGLNEELADQVGKAIRWLKKNTGI